MVALAVVAAVLAGSRVQSANQTAVGFDPFSAQASAIPPAADERPGGGPIIPQISFSNNDISMVLQIISDATGWSVFPSADVCKAKISLWAKNISADQLLETVVTLAGFTYHRQGNTIMVMTYDEYAQYHGLAKEVKSLRYANAEAVANVVKPFLSKLGKSVVHQKTNAIVLFDSPANLMTIADIVEKLDVPEDAQTILEVIDLKYMDSLQLADTLQKVFTDNRPAQSLLKASEQPSTPVPGDRITETPTATPAGLSSPQSGVGVFSLDRTNQLIIKAFQGDIEKLKKLVEKLDTYVEPTSRNYHFVYVDAAEIFPGLERILNLPTRGSGAYGGGRSRGSRTTGRAAGSAASPSWRRRIPSC